MSVATTAVIRRTSASAGGNTSFRDHHFLEDRSAILQPVLTHAARIIRDHRDYELAVRASQVLLESEEPSARTFFCAKSVVSDYIARHPRDPRGHRELGKTYLFSCGGDETIALAETSLHRSAELSNHQDPETFFLLAACARSRLFALAPNSPQYHRLFQEAERNLKLALRHSFDAQPYRFALSDFYVATEKPNLALAVLEEGLAVNRRRRSQDAILAVARLDVDEAADAPILEELGKFGMRIVADFCSQGQTDQARQVCQGALAYLRRALRAAGDGNVHGEGGSSGGGSSGELDDDERREWEVELEEAERIYEDLTEGTLFDFSSEPDFNPRHPEMFSKEASPSGAHQSAVISPLWQGVPDAAGSPLPVVLHSPPASPPQPGYQAFAAFDEAMHDAEGDDDAVPRQMVLTSAHEDLAVAAAEAHSFRGESVFDSSSKGSTSPRGSKPRSSLQLPLTPPKTPLPLPTGAAQLRHTPSPVRRRKRGNSAVSTGTSAVAVHAPPALGTSAIYDSPQPQPPYMERDISPDPKPRYGAPSQRSRSSSNVLETVISSPATRRTGFCGSGVATSTNRSASLSDSSSGQDPQIVGLAAETGQLVSGDPASRGLAPAVPLTRSASADDRGRAARTRGRAVRRQPRSIVESVKGLLDRRS